MCSGDNCSPKVIHYNSGDSNRDGYSVATGSNYNNFASGYNSNSNYQSNDRDYN